MPNKFRNATLADVAATARVTPMTVSRYFNHPERVSPKTKAKIRKAVEELGYSPNLAARILMGQSSNGIGLVVPTLMDPYYAAVANSVQQTARDRNYLVWVASTEGSQDAERAVLEQMCQHHVDGILLVPAVGPQPWTDEMKLPPLVTLDRPIPAHKCDAVLVENFRGAALATDHLIDHGYRQIVCLVMDDPAGFTAKERVGGYEDAMRRRRLRPKSIAALATREQLRKQLKSLMASKSPPRAIFAANNVTTVHVLEFLLDAGIDIPGTVALFGFDDFELAAYLRPAISVIRQSATDVGRHATQRLFEHIDRETFSSGTHLVLPVEMLLRGSCGCARKEDHPVG